jgi:hypothetical protein
VTEGEWKTVEGGYEECPVQSEADARPYRTELSDSLLFTWRSKELVYEVSKDVSWYMCDKAGEEERSLDNAT